MKNWLSKYLKKINQILWNCLGKLVINYSLYSLLLVILIKLASDIRKNDPIISSMQYARHISYDNHIDS